MKEKLSHVAVFGNHYQQPYIAQINEFLHRLGSLGVKIDIEKKFSDYLKKNSVAIGVCNIVDRPETGTDVVLSFGGDGTFLHTAEWVGQRNIPILGINTGHLGFLSTFTLNEMDHLISSLTNQTLIVEQRTLLHVSSEALPADVWPYALNEVAILKSNTSSMISVRTTINDFYLTDYLGDGLLLATPTGSTGYNLSVGGPILQPSSDNFVISPIAPHSLTMRPLVVSGESVVGTVTSSRVGTYRVSLDGRSFSVDCSNSLTIKKAPFTISIMRRCDDDFARTLRTKLLWGQR